MTRDLLIPTLTRMIRDIDGMSFVPPKMVPKVNRLRRRIERMCLEATPKRPSSSTALRTVR